MEAHVPAGDVVLFTAEKLETFGVNLAKAMLLHHSLSGAVQRCIKAASRKGQETQEFKPWPEICFSWGSQPGGTPACSGSTTPSYSGDEAAGEDDDGAAG